MDDQRRSPFEELDVFRAACALTALVHGSAIRDEDLRAQATRAAESALVNVAEGLPDERQATRRRFLLRADGSLHEALAAVDLAAAIEALDERRAAEILGVAASVRGMLRRLLHVRGRAV